MKTISLAPFVLALGLMLAPVASAQTQDIYIAQTAAGGATGADCADALPYTFFNASGNWAGSFTSGKISPGTTVHICNTWTLAGGTTNVLTTQGNGTSGAPIVILFETNAVIQAPYWSGNVIQVNNNYITVNGGTNGTIQATANGTLLANQQDNGTGVKTTGSNILVENLIIANMYVRNAASAGTATIGGNTGAVYSNGGSNIQWTNITAHDVHWALDYASTGGTTSNITCGPGNNIYNVDHGCVISIGNGTVATMSQLYVYGNHIHDFQVWDPPSVGGPFHHDGVHIFDFGSDFMSQVYVYNNLIDGNWGINDNAGIYMESNDEGGSITSCGLFNNVFNNTGTNSASGPIADYTNQGCLDANNTLEGSANPGLNCEFQSSAGCTLYNNILISQFRQIQAQDGGKITASDYNDIYPAPTGGSNSFVKPGGGCCIDTLANWRTQTGFDSHSITGNPNLTSGYVPNRGSPVIAAGINLNSICTGQSIPGLGALCFDAAGNARPATANWDMGAYESGTAGAVTLTPASYNFATTVVGQASSDSPSLFTLANSSGSTITSISISFTGANPGDFSQTTSCGSSLSTGSNCAINVTFTPAAVGSRTATLSVSNSGAGSPQTSSLSGTAVPTVTNPSPANPVTFGVVVTDPSLPSTVRNEKQAESLSAYNFDHVALVGFLHQDRARNAAGASTRQ